MSEKLERSFNFLYMLAITQFIIVFSTVKYIKAKRKLH